MTTVNVNTASLSDINLLDRSRAEPGQEPRSELDMLLAVAGDTAASPVTRGQALAQADALTGGREQTLLAQAGGSAPVTTARTTAATSTLTLARTDSAPQRAAGVAAQLTTESRLAQLGGDRTTAAGLDGLARKLIDNPGLLVGGSYRSVQLSREPIHTTRGNPLAIPRLSNPEASLQRISGQIQQLEALQASAIALHQRRPSVGTAGQIVGLQRQLDQLRTERDANIDSARLAPGAGFNGSVFRAVATGSNPNATPVIFINGINTDINRSYTQAMELSDTLNVPIDHVVNVSSRQELQRVGQAAIGDNVIRRGDFDPQSADLRIQQHATGNPPAAESAANLILRQLDTTTGKVKIIGYSQGAAIGTEALRMVRDTLVNERGLSGDALRRELGRIEFLGIGPAAAERHLTRTFADGTDGSPATIRQRPELGAVNYSTIADRNDPIAALLNVTDQRFTSGRAPPGASADVGRSAAALQRLGQPGAFTPHLSYFQSYTLTDPGSIYNRDATTQLHKWFAGNDIGNQVIDLTRRGDR